MTRLRRLRAAAEHDLLAFHGLAAAWCTAQLPELAPELTGALARALAVGTAGPGGS
ncbi:hypothetical protein QIS99_15615 [Streptomyces sp. B-S-A8]|uniref:Uncharacterized protein n=1 Tax=Streptomyces solicavernae TaxID=3043614 RepID=A0ABT6RT69_9ACTN|nr:hypothetical protein [Streptomyces sp. B-S-A8]MDI3387618.1 hypothetical protein [Streptomyces sp. B-S-A8]